LWKYGNVDSLIILISKMRTLIPNVFDIQKFPIFKVYKPNFLKLFMSKFHRVFSYPNYLSAIAILCNLLNNIKISANIVMNYDSQEI
jgi:hypothetical protein